MRDKLTIFLVSVSLIGFQLSIINILSYSQWHHFAYLAVSIAMLGFGTSGVIISIKPMFFLQIAEKHMTLLIILCGLLISFTPIAINSDWARFDTFLLFSDYKHIIKLLITCIILFMPFFVGASIIAMFLMTRNRIIPKLYAWNLFGSAVGGVILILLSKWLLPMNLAAFFGLITLIAGLILCRRSLQVFITFMSIFAVFFVLRIQDEKPFTSQYKTISKSLLLPETRIVETIASPQGVVEFVESSTMRQSQGSSLNFIGEIPYVDVAFLNGEAYFAFLKRSPDKALFNQNLFALPYSLSKSTKSLFINPGSTFNPLQAIYLGSNSVMVVEPVKAVSQKLGNYDWGNSTVNIINSYPREYLNQTKEKWDLIQFPLVGSFGGSAGISALQEQYMFTTDALKIAMGKITCEGIISLSTYMDSPPRNSLKIIALVHNTLISLGFNPERKFLAARSWNTILILLKPVGFSERDLIVANNFCSQNGFDMVFPTSNENNNLLSDSTFNYIACKILNSETDETLRKYPFNIEPPSDNSPFFSQFLKMSRLRDYNYWLGGNLPFIEVGYLIVWICLCVCVLIALFSFAFPIIFSIKRRVVDIPLWCYFAFIGLGYMLIEIALIQKSILIVRNPVTASALIISSILCFSALGSYFSNRTFVDEKSSYIFVCIVVFILLIVILSQNLFSHLTSFPIWSRILVLILVISPLAFLMGMPFPLVMKRISVLNPHQIPIVWGINGFFSVIAAPIGTIVAVESGFNQVLVLSALFYLLCVPLAMIFKNKF